MRGRNKWIQGIILTAVLLIGGYTIGSSLFAKEDIPREGSTAPDFSLTGLDGSKVSLSDYRGKPVIVNFWGSWCEPCIREMPAIQRQYEKWKDKGLVVLGLNLDESRVTVQSFVQQTGVTFPVLFDKELRMRDRYAVRYYPTTFFIDPQGKIVKIAVLEMDDAYIEQTIQPLLKQ
ncbi:thiol-disulfide oxidoreductase ResA [Paenibacillus ginsengarvi]|uniref:Thiol-disulfide oxidoreductase ResA n=1 Tax=Paenibacillus ginsengarvi TaxID=400777 RepID=A0A3B0CJ75_9BACL|nr:thiol-disulfide oxidoreductase ResA [Paenibacillus ginsengarvi]RKN84624.1 thiol-disulfide oxidoreductase ResA [Paenibacillus ginsengarvi]